MLLTKFWKRLSSTTPRESSQQRAGVLRTGRDSENQFRIFVSAGFHSRTLSCSQKSKSDATTTLAGRQLSSHAHARYITVSCFSIVENHQFDKSKTKRLHISRRSAKQPDPAVEAKDIRLLMSLRDESTLARDVPLGQPYQDVSQFFRASVSVETSLMICRQNAAFEV